MTLKLLHDFVSPKADGTDPTVVKPSNWNAEHDFTTDQVGGIVLGRDTSGAGAIQELPLSFNPTSRTFNLSLPNARFYPGADWQAGITGGSPLPINTTQYNNGAGTLNPNFSWSPTPGIWHFDVQTSVMQIQPDASGSIEIQITMALDIFSGGITRNIGMTNEIAILDVQIVPRISCDMQVLAGDVVQVYYSINGSGALYNFSGGASFLSGHRIG